MKMLHTVNKSPFERNTLESCLRLAEKDSAVLLIEDAVVAATDKTPFAPTLTEALSRVSVYVLGADLDARGVPRDRVIDAVEVIDYEKFVDLACQYDSVQSWL